MGFAQQLFLERHNKPLSEKPKTPTFQWPLLEELTANGYFAAIDKQLALQLLEKTPDASQETALFIAYLLLTARQGHLCVRIENARLFPHPTEIWTEISEEKTLVLTNEAKAKLASQMIEGAKSIPPAILFQAENTREISSQPICFFLQCYYLQRNWHDETTFLYHFNRLEKADPVLSLNHEKSESIVQEMQAKGLLLEEQKQAILKGCTEAVTIISGGPGTGKTYTAGMFIKVFWNSLSAEDQKKCKICLAAPTGKAAGNLQNSLNKVIDDLDNFTPLTAQTLHSLFEIRSRSTYEPTHFTLNAHLLIIDECSMIDIALMAQIVSSLKSGTRLVLIGDSHQLSPVEPGSTFADILRYKEAMGLPVSHLKVCLRAELQTIIDLAEAVREGSVGKIFPLLSTKSTYSGIEKLPFDDTQDIKKQQATLVKLIVQNIPSNTLTPEEYFRSLSKFCVLTTLRKGPFGVEEMNELIHQSKKDHEEWSYTPLLITRNASQLKLFNGDVGLLVQKNSKHATLKKSAASITSKSSRLKIQAGDYALFYENQGEKNQKSIRKIPALLLPSYELAYCMTVHKSQGSEFQQVLLLLPEGSEKFGRQGLYTAITRAKQQLKIWAKDSVLIETINFQKRRISGICERFSLF